MSLNTIGWNTLRDDEFSSWRERGFEPARVAREDRDRYLLLTEAGERPGELSGRLRHDAASRLDLPVVGDWVAVRDDGSLAVVHGVLSRRTAFVRQATGEATNEQALAANIDVVFVVAGLDHDLNLRRVERYLAAAWDSGAAPVVVLNKADLASDLEANVEEVETVAAGVPVIAVAAREGRGVEALAPWLEPGTTVALLGSSGVGKSTLVNALLGENRQATADVREHDSRGRHTTTSRTLIPLPGGAVLLDTPGIRSLALWTDESSLEGAFGDIAERATQCRFTDCAHEREPGCAVRAAIESGELDSARLESFHKLQRELRWLASRQDARLRAEEEAKWKAITKSMKHHPKAHRWR